MDTKKIKSISQIKKECAEQEFKFIRLCDLNGNPIVSFNPTHTKGFAANLAKKWQEIERRMKHLDPGVYMIEARSKMGGSIKPYPFFVGNKNYDPNSLNDAPVPVIPPVDKVAARPQLNEKKTEHLLSVDTALEYATDNARLTAENESLKRDLTEWKTKYAELEAELDDPENGISDPNKKHPLIELADNVGTTFLPVIDRYMSFLEKKQKHKDTKLLLDNGYDLPGFSRGSGGSAGIKRAAKPAIDFNSNIPNIGDPAWPQYIAWLGKLSDDAFEEHLGRVETASKPVYDAIVTELGVQFDDEPDTEE